MRFLLTTVYSSLNLMPCSTPTTYIVIANFFPTPTNLHEIQLQISVLPFKKKILKNNTIYKD